MKAIILAAGKGSRLYPITLSKPKGLLEVGGETILDRLIRQFKTVGINDILLVVGYQKDKYMDHFGKSVRYSVYDNFHNTNNLHTLWSVREELNDDVIITFSDLVLHGNIINKLLGSKYEITMTVDTRQVLDGTMRVEVDGDKLLNIKTTSIEKASGNFIGLSKLSKVGCNVLVNEMSSLINSNYDDYYTLAIDNLARRNEVIGCCDVNKMLWREIDTKDEYDEVNSIWLEFNK